MIRTALVGWGVALTMTVVTARVDAADLTPMYSGKVVSTLRVQLIIEIQDGTQKSFVVAAETKVKLDGKDAAVQDLRMGYLVKVSAKDVGDQLVADSIDAMKVDAIPSEPSPSQR